MNSPRPHRHASPLPFPKRLLLLLSLFGAFSCGCVSVATSGGAKSVTPASTQTSYHDVRVDGFEPVVQRTGTGTVTIRFEATGCFPYEKIETRRYRTEDSERMAFGFFPGLAESSPDNMVGDALIAFWYNLCFCGLPTVHGLLFEPFAPVSTATAARGSMGERSGTSRAALLGFYRYRKYASVQTDPTPKRSVGTLDKVSLDAVSLSPVDCPFPVRSSGMGFLTLGNVPAGPQECRVRLSFPANDPLHDALAPLILRPFTVAIPE